MKPESPILQLPYEQKIWLKSVKDLFHTTFYTNTFSVEELTVAIEKKAIERNFLEIGQLINSSDLKDFFEK